MVFRRFLAIASLGLILTACCEKPHPGIPRPRPGIPYSMVLAAITDLQVQSLGQLEVDDTCSPGTLQESCGDTYQIIETTNQARLFKVSFKEDGTSRSYYLVVGPCSYVEITNAATICLRRGMALVHSKSSDHWPPPTNDSDWQTCMRNLDSGSIRVNCTLAQVPTSNPVTPSPWPWVQTTHVSAGAEGCTLAIRLTDPGTGPVAHVVLACGNRAWIASKDVVGEVCSWKDVQTSEKMDANGNRTKVTAVPMWVGGLTTLAEQLLATVNEQLCP